MAALSFRRLSILDLSPLGHQPMVSQSGRFVMVFNGEVYNFQEIRKSLRAGGVSFRGGSDTEVILAAFEKWGVDRTLPMLIGMFAIALWDRESEEMTLVRDRMGIKPLYVATTKRGVAFASELSAVMAAPGLDTALDMDAVESYLRYLFVPAPGTPLHSVRKVPPGHVLRLRTRSLAQDLPPSEPFWCLHDDAKQPGEGRLGAGTMKSEDHYVDELERLLADSVRLRLIADVPVGAFLSGGIDSSLVVALMARQSPGPVRTFTIGFDEEEYDESEHADAISKHFGTDHTLLMLSGRDALDVVPHLPEIFDEPLGDPSMIPTFLVSRLARSEVKVALSGDGGDELFGGYNRYASGGGLFRRISRIPRLPRRWLGSLLTGIPDGFWDRTLNLQGTERLGTVRLAGQKANKLGRLMTAESPGAMYRALLSTRDDPDQLLAIRGSGSDPIGRALEGGTGCLTLGDMLLVDQAYYLPDDLLQKVDRASMAVSLEVRVPILDHRVVEFSWGVPDALKIQNGVAKYLLRRVLDRYVPSRLVDRPKTGFSVPVGVWLRGPLREWGADLLMGNSPLRDEIFARAPIQAAWGRLLAGRNEEALSIWAVLMFEAWRRRWNIDDVRVAA